VPRRELLARIYAPAFTIDEHPAPLVRQNQLGELSAAVTSNLRIAEDMVRYIRDAIECRVYVLMAGGFTHAELAEACRTDSQELVDAVCRFAARNELPWPPAHPSTWHEHSGCFESARAEPGSDRLELTRAPQ
jgi:hypothetical protein